MLLLIANNPLLTSRWVTSLLDLCKNRPSLGENINRKRLRSVI